jgi:hypothetical protein
MKFMRSVHTLSTYLRFNLTASGHYSFRRNAFVLGHRVHHPPSLSFFLQILCGLDSLSLHTIRSSFKIRVLIGEFFSHGTTQSCGYAKVITNGGFRATNSGPMMFLKW